ncbi:MAG: outer membrane protein assembly factor BamA [Candidatus Aminicenantes bacterium]|nr:outer membrane protein assembly factor BamA [Candidatus Aminicenantes bacterium]
MRKLAFVFIFICLPLFLLGQEIVEKIDIEGNERVTKETILYYLSSREGDYYSKDLLQRDFRVLWSTGFFANIKIEESFGSQGRIVKIIVEENPVIKDIVYNTGKKVKEDDIVNKLKEKNEYLLPYSYYSPYKTQKIKSTIEDLMLEKGLTSGKVETEVKPQGKNELNVVFKIDEGPKLRVGDLSFEGSPKLLESTLRGAFKDNKEHGVISWITGKDTFKQNKLTENLDNLKRIYQEHGYMEAVIGEPRIEEFEKHTVLFKKQTMKRIVIPVNAGYRYFVGDIKIDGNKVFNSDYLRTLIKYEEGDIYSTKVREDAVKEIGELYQNFGHLYAQIRPVESLDPKRKKVNVTYNVYEGEVAYLHRLNISGNTYTKDKVIRRELLLREGDRFSFALFKDSLLRMNQLGLVEMEGEPDIQPNPQDPTQINVSLKVTELQRNNIQFTAGYSGYQGTFVAISYGTVNFLGAGEKLDLMFQYGKRIRNYSFGFTEPYIFDRPMSLGFNIYDRYMVYPYLYNRKERGIDLVFGARVKGYVRTSITYGYQFINIEEPSEDDEYYPYYPNYYSSYYSYYGAYGLGNWKMSYLYPSIYRNTVDSPLTPSRGSLYLIGVKFSGGFLGGDIDIIKPRIELARYIPTFKNQSIGMHLEYQFIHAMNDNALPFWEKFYLGGERSIRGYDIYSIGPRTPEGRLFGGSKSLVLNFEYIMPVGGPLYAIVFYDAGNAYAEGEAISFKNLFTSAGLEARIFVPALRVPFRLIFAYNNRFTPQNKSHFNFRFAIGTTF